MPVDLSASRHLGGHLPGTDDPWKCPRCGSEQAGPFSQGCQSCGGGKPGFKAPAPTEPPTRMPRNAGEGPLASILATNAEPDDVQAFREWVAGKGPLDDDLVALLEEAFLAGMSAARQGGGAGVPPSPFPGADLTATQRTVIAALEIFVDQVLGGEPEEVASGEWLSAEATRAVIRRLREGGDL